MPTQRTARFGRHAGTTLFVHMVFFVGPPRGGRPTGLKKELALRTLRSPDQKKSGVHGSTHRTRVLKKKRTRKGRNTAAQMHRPQKVGGTAQSVDGKPTPLPGKKTWFLGVLIGLLLRFGEFKLASVVVLLVGGPVDRRRLFAISGGGVPSSDRFVEL